MTPSLIETEEKEETLQAIADEGDSPADDYSGAGSEIANASQTGLMSNSALGGGGGGGRRGGILDRLRDFAERKLRNNILKRTATKIWEKVTGKTAAKAEQEAAAKAAEKLAAEGGAKGTAEVLEKGAAEAAPSLAKGALKGTAEVVGRLAEPAYVAYDGYKAVSEAKKGDYREAAGYVGDAGGFVGGAGAGAGLGALAGIETGPGAIVTGLVGGVIGGFMGEKGVKALYDRYKDKLPNWMHRGDTPSQPQQAQQALQVNATARAAVPAAAPSAAPAQTQNHPATPAAAPVPAQPHAPNYHGELPGPATLFVVGDSIAKDMGLCCEGNVQNLAVASSHITTQTLTTHQTVQTKDGPKTVTETKTLMGALEQLDIVMNGDKALGIAAAKKGDTAFVHEGWNDLGRPGTKTYNDNFVRFTSQLEFLQSQGINVVVALPTATNMEGSHQVDAKTKALVKDMATYQAKVLADHHIKFIDKQVDFLSNDGVHPKDWEQSRILTSAMTEGTGIRVKSTNKPQAVNHPANTQTPPVASPHPAVAHAAQGKPLIHPNSQVLADQLELHKYEKQYGLPPGIMLAVMDTECRGNTQAVSPVGACGPFQFMPDTAREYGVKDSFDPRQSAEGAAKKLSDLNREYHGDAQLMAAAYNLGSWGLAKRGIANASPEVRDQIMKAGLANAPAETRNLVAKTGLDHASDKTRERIAQIGFAHASAETKDYVNRTGLAHAPNETRDYVVQVTAKMNGGDPLTPQAGTTLAASARQPKQDPRAALPSGPTPGSGKPQQVAELAPERHTVAPHAAMHGVTDG